MDNQLTNHTIDCVAEKLKHCLREIRNVSPEAHVAQAIVVDSIIYVKVTGEPGTYVSFFCVAGEDEKFGYADMNKVDRAEIAKRFQKAGYTIKQIAEFMNEKSYTVSKWLKASPEADA